MAGEPSLFSKRKPFRTPMSYLIKRCTHTIGLLLLAAALGFVSTPALAQVDIKPGVKVGGNFATIGGDDAELVFGLGGLQQEVPIDRRSGFMIGGFALIDLAGPIDLQPELLYVQKGAKSEIEFSFGGQTHTSTTTLKLDYLQVPLLAKFQLPVTGPMSPNLLAGPNLGFNISATTESEAGGESESEDIDGISGTDFGFTIGGGIDFGLAGNSATIDLRYELGLSDLPDEGEASIKNRGIGITAGLVF